MSFLALIVSVAFTVAMILQMIRPFLASRGDQLRFEVLEDDLREIETLLDRKAALVQMLRDLEYDYETDKIAEEDYRRFKLSCERQAVAVMRRLDTIHGGRHWQTVIDEALAWEATSEVATAEDETLPAAAEEDPPQRADEALLEEETLQCRACAAPLEVDDLFCGKCGTPVKDVAEIPTEEAPELKKALG